MEDSRKEIRGQQQKERSRRKEFGGRVKDGGEQKRRSVEKSRKEITETQQRKQISGRELEEIR